MQHSTNSEEGFLQRNRNLIKGFLVSFLILMLMIPTFFITDLIRERQIRQEQVKQEIATQWGQKQTLSGPLLVIPYWKAERKQNGQVIQTKALSYYLPHELNVGASLAPEYRSRSSIFKLIVYTASLTTKGYFEKPNFEKLKISKDQLIPEEAYILYGINDFTGIQDKVVLKWNQEKHEMTAGSHESSTIQSGLVCPVKLQLDENNQQYHFELMMQLRGAETIRFLPLGKSTQVEVKAPWPHPSFVGNTLPNHQIDSKQFTASWKVFEINRAFAQQWTGEQAPDLSNSEFGVTLLQPLDNYAKTSRTIKYAILVIMLTFVIYFFIEVLQRKQVHVVQYVLIGFALCVFYTLLLAISEYTTYMTAYVIAGSATITLISLYTKSVFGSWRMAGLFSMFMTSLYGFIYMLIQLQDGALLAGSIGLFLILAAIMYVSRKIEWYK